MQYRITILDMVERLQDRVLADGVAVFQHPLDFTYPHGDACEFRRVGIELDAEHIGRRAFDADLAVQAELFGFEVCLVFEVFQHAQGEI